MSRRAQSLREMAASMMRIANANGRFLSSVQVSSRESRKFFSRDDDAGDAR
jgi:hypothetical protein